MTKEQLKQSNRLVKKAARESFAVGSVISRRFRIERILLMNIQKKMVFGIGKEDTVTGCKRDWQGDIC